MSGNPPPPSPPYVTGSGASTNAEHPVVRILDNRLSASEISPSGELFRAFDRYNRRRINRGRSIGGVPGDQAGSSSSDPSADNESQLLGRETQLELQDTINFLAQIPGVATGSGTNTSTRHPRTRIIERSRYLDRHRSLPNNRHPEMTPSANAGLSSIADLHHAGQQLETASQQMRALLDDSQNILAQSSITAAEYAGEAETNRAFKRRKIDTSMTSSSFPGPSYGHFGQVEPGKLRMEIESCDGGTFLEGFAVGCGAYGATNVLKNDDSVYCTKGNRCNLVLRHQGSTPFSLTELIIKGPPRDYTDPVQEGMVFVSMEADDLLNRTAQYQIQYSAPRNPTLRRRANRDPNNDGIISIRHNTHSTTSGVDNGHRQHLYATVCEEHEDGLAQIPADFFVHNAPPFNVTTECYDSDTDSNDDVPVRRRRDGGGISDRLSAFLSGVHDQTDDSESDEDMVVLGPRGERAAAAPSSSQLRPRPEDSQTQLSSFQQRPRSLATPNYNPPRMSAGLLSAVNAAQEATSEAVKAVGGIPSTTGSSSRPKENALMAPLAWFFIQEDKSKCAIRFDPPVSGRFILLKMWSPHHTPAGNIDIQSVVAKGFAGPRFFPAGKMR